MDYSPYMKGGRMATFKRNSREMFPKYSMYGAFTNGCLPSNQPNEGKYTIHGVFGLWFASLPKKQICQVIQAVTKLDPQTLEINKKSCSTSRIARFFKPFPKGILFQFSKKRVVAHAVAILSWESEGPTPPMSPTLEIA